MIAIKASKILSIALILFVVTIVGSFIYTRFLINKYYFSSERNSMTFNGITYVGQNSLSETDTKNIGKIIGIAVPDKRTFTDYIWPFWIREYKDHSSYRDHYKIFVRGLMDLGRVYTVDKK